MNQVIIIKLKECSHVSTNKIVFASLPNFSHFMSYSFSKTLAYAKTTNSFLVKLSLIRMSSIWKASNTYNDIEFCKEAKTIIIVDIWSNSLIHQILDVYIYNIRFKKKVDLSDEMTRGN